MISSEPKSTWQHLRQEDGGSVTIHSKDGDCFGLPIDDVVNACKSKAELTEFCRQVGTLLNRLAAWLEERGGEVGAAYVGLEPEGAIFVVVRKAKAFDPAFEDSLSILDLEVAQDSEFETHQAPGTRASVVFKGNRCLISGVGAGVSIYRWSPGRDCLRAPYVRRS